MDNVKMRCGGGGMDNEDVMWRRRNGCEDVMWRRRNG